MNPLRILFLVFILATTASLEGIVHVVKKGENLTTISKAYNVSVSELKKVNNIKDANNISIGQKLQIPGTAPRIVEYKVRSGESLSTIAARHGVKAKEIAAFNGIRDFNKIRAGQVIKIPSKTGEAARKYSRLPWSVRNALAKIPVKQGQWKNIVIHHSGTVADRAKNIDRFHREERNMENGIAYHFVIENGTRGTKNGDIYISERWKKQLHGGHMKLWAHNQIAIGICLIGNFEKSRPKAKQMEQLEALIAYLQEKTGVPGKGVTTHTMMHPNHTLCPGKLFPTNQLKRIVN
jgi:LysM repeat protein